MPLWRKESTPLARWLDGIPAQAVTRPLEASPEDQPRDAAGEERNSDKQADDQVDQRREQSRTH